jgi:hypothetical protein
MSKEIDISTIFECWQNLQEYISAKDQIPAAEQLLNHFRHSLTDEEFSELADMDHDLFEAYEIIMADEFEDDSNDRSEYETGIDDE